MEHIQTGSDSLAERFSGSKGHHSRSLLGLAVLCHKIVDKLWQGVCVCLCVFVCLCVCACLWPNIRIRTEQMNFTYSSTMFIVYPVTLLALHTLGAYLTVIKLVQNVCTHTDMGGKWNPIDSVTGEVCTISDSYTNCSPSPQTSQPYSVYKRISITYHQAVKLQAVVLCAEGDASCVEYKLLSSFHSLSMTQSMLQWASTELGSCMLSWSERFICQQHP